ncbi:uncharacterized protein EAF01_001272 [Botrytis porri]|uniref:uncharacterized protein n=1 Tax=Botrytis porri TaxID=87229 RepID=UPI0019006445|nr:uncharacterized protein EAF01_001272 [Botrytis porri]KAF7912251.1 hypothetical protein EAF01_001272 [Botrytis porri]
MTELEYIEPCERFGRVGSRVVELRMTPASGYLYHDETVSEDKYTSGWRLLSMGIFSAQMESSIVSTSILSITNESKGFDEASWVFTSYMLTHAGVQPTNYHASFKF